MERSAGRLSALEMSGDLDPLGLPDGALLDEIVEGANRGPVRVLQRGQRLRGRARRFRYLRMLSRMASAAPIAASTSSTTISASRLPSSRDNRSRSHASTTSRNRRSTETPVRHPRARVDVRLDGIGFHQALAEAVDGRASDLVDGLRSNDEILPLLRGKSVREACLQFRGNLVGEERRDEIPNPRKKFAGGHLGESDGRDRLWRNPAREQHCDAPRHDRGLA